MKCTRISLGCFVAGVILFAGCVHDYDPFENYSNANVVVSGTPGPKLIRNGDSLSVFATETLQVFTTVREKIDSFRVTATGNRYFTDSVLRPPFSVDYSLLFSFYDTGWASIGITTYRSNNTSVSLPLVKVFAYSPLKQKDVDTVFGTPYLLKTLPVGDDDVLYVWAFGKDTVKRIGTDSIFIPYSDLAHAVVGQLDTGYLFVSDFSETTLSPKSPFTYLFFKPSPPKIKCTNKVGLSHDTVVTGSDTLVFQFQVTDSSGQGVSVAVNGILVQANDTTGNVYTYHETYLGMKAFTNQKAKAVTVTAVDKLGDSTLATFYLCYESSGPQGDLALIKLANPTTPALTTRIDTLLYDLTVYNYTGDTTTVTTTVTGPAGKQTGILPIYVFSDSLHKCPWFVPLGIGSNAIHTQVSIISRGYLKDTTVLVTRNALAPDTSAPVITGITVNGAQYPLATQTYFDVDSPAVTVTVSAIDNESGIKLVTISQSAGVGTIALVDTLKYSNHVWTSTAILFPTAGRINVGSQTMNLTVTVKNGLVQALTKTQTLLLRRAAIAVTPGQ